MIKRLAAVLGVVVFLVLAGTGAGYAYWSATAEARTSVTIGDLAAANCVNPVGLVNGGFETPAVSGTIQTGVTGVPGWQVAAGGQIEFWRGYTGDSDANPVITPEGAQFLELNGNGSYTLYQDVSVQPGQVLNWSLQHRGRRGSDTMYVAIYAANQTPSSAFYQIPSGRSTSAITTGKTFTPYSGSYVVPANYNANVKLRFALVPGATSTGDSTIGNLVDNVSFGSGPCLDLTSSIENVASKSGIEPGDTVTVTTTIANAGGPSAATVLTLPRDPRLGAPTSVLINGIAASAQLTLGSSALTVRIGTGASGSAGGAVGSSPVVVSYRATVTGALGETISTTPAVRYGDPQYPGWDLQRTGATVTRAIEDVTPPAKPASLVVAATGETSTSLTWTTSTPSDVHHYVVQRVSSTGTWAEVATPSSAALVDGSASPGQAYAYRVQAVDAAGNASAWSDVSAAVITSFGSHSYQAAWMNGATPVCVQNGGGSISALQNAANCNAADAKKWKVSGTGTGIQVTPAAGTSRWLQKRTCTWFVFCDWETSVTVQEAASNDYSLWTFLPVYDAASEHAFITIKNTASGKLLYAGTGSTAQLSVGSTGRSFFFTQVS